MVLLHNGGFCNNATALQVHFQTNAYKTPLSHNGYMKSLEIYENYITLFFLKKQTF
jgi:hypothetical protein